jgi:putative transcriptional regulator
MHPNITRGDLLIASASLLDANFVRTVVLICDHSDADGTYGLVLNRPVPVPDEVKQSLPFELDCLYQGGPVRVEAMQVIHPYGELVPECLEVLPGVWLGGTFDVLCRGFREGTMEPRRCRFCLGYSGWGGGQLAQEFTQEAWLHTRGSPALVYETPADKVWARAVRQYGQSHPLFRFFPDDPTCN